MSIICSVLHWLSTKHADVESYEAADFPGVPMPLAPASAAPTPAEPASDIRIACASSSASSLSSPTRRWLEDSQGKRPRPAAAEAKAAASKRVSGEPHGAYHATGRIATAVY
jgi:hypothetical protein